MSRNDPVSDLFHRIGAWTDTNPMYIPATILIRWPIIFYRQLRRDNAFIRAAGMAYITLVSIVPMLVLVFAVLRSTGILGHNPDVVYETLFGTFFHEIPDVKEFLLPGLLSVDLRALSITGIAGLIIIAARLYMMVEKAYNDIYGVEIDRNFMHRLLNFYFTLTAVPVVAVITVMGTYEMASGYGLPLDWGVSDALQLVLFFAALKMFPCTKVEWTAAAVGAFVTYSLTKVGGWGFGWYLRLFASDDPLQSIYGAMGVVPIFLLWLYMLWIFILLGVEVAHSVQNYDSLVAAELEQLERDRAPWRRPSVDVAIEAATWIAWSYESGRGPVTLEKLCERADLPARDLGPVLRVLESSDYILHSEHGWVLARPPEKIELADLVRSWRQATTLGQTGMNNLADEIENAIIERMEGTLADAVARWVPNPDRPITMVVKMPAP